MLNSIKIYKASICLVVLLIGTVLPAKSQVVINEFTAANFNDHNFGSYQGNGYKDWVELYNTSGSVVDLTGYWLSDDVQESQKWSFPSGSLIGPEEFMVVLLSGLDDLSPEPNEYRNTNFKLRQSGGEEIVFSNPSGEIIESYDFDEIGVNAMNHSFARIVDGTGELQISTNPSPENSNVGEFGTAYAPKPFMNLAPGFYQNTVSVSITCEDLDAEIYYTLDGTSPSNTSLLYTGELTIEATTPLRAIAYSIIPTELPSLITTNTYFINVDPHTVPVLSLTGDDIEVGQWIGKMPSVAELFDAEGNFVSKAHGQSNEHGADSNAFPQRGFDFVAKDEMGHDHHLTHDFFHNTDRSEYQRLIFQAGGTDNYPGLTAFETMHMRGMLANQLSIKSGLDVDARSDAFCVVYLNGNYHGLYSMREKVDDPDYFEHYYNQDENSVDYIKTWGGTWNEYGTIDSWEEVVEYVGTNSLSSDAQYEWISEHVEISSMNDFFILQSYLTNINWMQWDHSWWRGHGPEGSALKWRYSLWDMDDLFWGINYTNMVDGNPDGLPCHFLTTGNPGGMGHIPLIDSLFQNPTFESQFVDRYIDLINTHFSCENVNLLIDSIENVMIPEMPRHVDRWGGSVEEWQNNIQAGRDFMDLRCDEVITALIDTCWDIQPIPEYYMTLVLNGAGGMMVNGQEITSADSPYELIVSGAGNTVNLEALDGDEYFVNWEVTSGELVIDDPQNPILSFEAAQDLGITAHFDTPDGMSQNDQPQFLMFPNPATDVVTIRAIFDIEKLQVVNVLGHVVKSAFPSGKHVQFDISQLSPGLYTVIIDSAQGQISSNLSIKD